MTAAPHPEHRAAVGALTDALQVEQAHEPSTPQTQQGQDVTPCCRSGGAEADVSAEQLEQAQRGGALPEPAGTAAEAAAAAAANRPPPSAAAAAAPAVVIPLCAGGSSLSLLALGPSGTSPATCTSVSGRHTTADLACLALWTATRSPTLALPDTSSAWWPLR